MTDAIRALIIAGGIGLGVLFLILIVLDRLGMLTSRIAAHVGSETAPRQSARIIRGLGAAFEGLAAPFGNMADNLDRDLTHAGRPYGGVSGRQYLAAAIVLGIMVGSAVGCFFAFMSFVQGNSGSAAAFSGVKWALICIPGVMIYLLMDAGGLARRNSDEVEREFPFFLDLAVLVVQAGGTPRKALTKYVEAMPDSPLSREIAITAKDADATSFEAALYRMIDRVRPTTVKTILKNLAQGEKSSGEVEHFYTAQAEEMRYLREEMATRTAERLKTNITFPVFLMLTAIVIAALAPTIVSIRAQGFF
jgi:tight adherence protein C